jgi:hypothetical protein
MVLVDEGSLLNCRRNVSWTETTYSRFTNCNTQNAFCSGVAIIAVQYYVTDQKRRREWDCACAQNLNTCCFVPCGKLNFACVFKAVMADRNRSNHFDTPCKTSLLQTGFFSALPPSQYNTRVYTTRYYIYECLLPGFWSSGMLFCVKFKFHSCYFTNLTQVKDRGIFIYIRKMKQYLSTHFMFFATFKHV